MRLATQDRITVTISMTLLGVLALATLWLVEWLRHDGAAGSHQPQRGVADTAVERLLLVKMDAQGKPISRVLAERMEHFDADDSSVLFQPDMLSLSAEAPPTRVRAREAWLTADAEDMLLRGDVVIERSGDGRRKALRIETESLDVNTDMDTATTQFPVLIVSDKSRLQGVGMAFDNIRQTVVLHRRVKGIYQP